VLNQRERSSAPMRSFCDLLASLKDVLAFSKEKLMRLEPGIESSESVELHAVLSVHSVPQRDSTSSFALGLQSPDGSFEFDSAASTARKAPSIAEIVLAASLLDSACILRLVGLGMRDSEAVAISGELGL